MSYSFACRKCGRRFHVEPAMAGKRARCRACGEVTPVPAPSVAADVDDPYGLIEAAAGEPEESVAPIASPTRRKGTASKAKGGWYRDGELGGKALLAVGGAAILIVLMGAASPALRTAAAVGLVLVGMVPLLVGTRGYYHVFRSEGLATRLLLVFVFPIGLLYLFRRWQEAPRAAATYWLGMLIALPGALWFLALHPPPGMAGPNLPPGVAAPSADELRDEFRRSIAYEQDAPKTDDQVVRDLYNLDSPGRATRSNALARLSSWPVVEAHRSRVVAAFRARLDSPEPEIRDSARRGFERWDPRVDVVPDLIASLNSPIVGVRKTSLDELASRKDARAGAPLAALLGEEGRRDDASSALRALGPSAEPAVLPRLKDGDPGVRASACEILAAIGTDAALPGLDAATRDPDPAVARQASAAMAACRGRAKAAPPRPPK